MDIQRISYLHQQYQNGKLTTSEQEEFKGLLDTPEFENQFKVIFDNIWQNLRAEDAQSMSEETQQQQVDYIINIPRKTPYITKLWPRIAVAAAILTIIFGAGLFYYAEYTKNQTVSYANDIAPGKNGATLTLANGKKIFINDALAGNIASQSGVTISKTKDGQLIYEITGDSSGKLEYNTLSTTRGEQAQVRLPDGSLVFLNAASSLAYPTTFAKQAKRIVSLKGEGYFEIFKDKEHPFIVSTYKQQVEVLGTHFNVNSYANEPISKTTLLEGSVKIASGGKQVILKPNQQATLGNNGLNIKAVDGDDAVAWKNGQFIFEDETLENIMKSVERWYDVDVTYQNGVDKQKKYWGGVSRYDKVSKVLENLQLTKNIHFKIEGRSIIVMK